MESSIYIPQSDIDMFFKGSTTLYETVIYQIITILSNANKTLTYADLIEKIDKLEPLRLLNYKEFMDILSIATSHLQKTGCIDCIKIYHDDHNDYSYGYTVGLKQLWRFHILLKKEELDDD